MKLNFLFFSILLSCLHLNAKELVDFIESDIQEVMTKVIEWRRHFHEYPELSNREFETSKYIKSKLEDMGLNVETGIAHTGLIAMIRGQKEGPLIALRADMDALPVEEKLNLPFSSTISKKSDSIALYALLASTCCSSFFTICSLCFTSLLFSLFLIIRSFLFLIRFLHVQYFQYSLVFFDIVFDVEYSKSLALSKLIAIESTPLKDPSLAAETVPE